MLIQSKYFTQTSFILTTPNFSFPFSQSHHQEKGRLPREVNILSCSLTHLSVNKHFHWPNGQSSLGRSNASLTRKTRDRGTELSLASPLLTPEDFQLPGIAPPGMLPTTQVEATEKREVGTCGSVFENQRCHRPWNPLIPHPSACLSEWHTHAYTRNIHNHQAIPIRL